MPAAITSPIGPYFSKNKIPVAIQSDDFRVAAAVNSVNFWEIGGPIAADTQLLFGWAAGAATMTAKEVPDDTGLQFPSGDGLNDYATSLLDYLRGNYFIDRDYELTTDFTSIQPKIVFTARAPGPDYDFDIFNAGATSVTTPGVTDQPVANFRHHIEAWIKTSGAFRQAYTANVPLDEPLTGVTTLDIHNELHAFLSSDRPVLTAAYAKCLNSAGQYLIKFAQYKGDDPSIRKVQTSAIGYIFKGGLGMQPNLLRSILDELAPGPAQNNLCLRQGSKNKLVSKLQPEWLTWVNFSDDTVGVCLKIIVANSDNSLMSFYTADPVDIAPYEKYQFQAGYTQLNISGRQSVDKMPILYLAQITTAAGVPLSADYGYVIDNTYREWPRYIVYENSYGAFQTIATVGKRQQEYDRKKDDAQLAVDRNLAAIDGDFLETNVTIQQKATLNIGYDRSGARNTALLRDLLLSRKVYLYDQVLIPIGFNTNNLKDAMDGVNVYANALEYYFLYEDETWTEDLQAVIDDSLQDLLNEAGSPVPNAVPPAVSDNGQIIVEQGDAHLSVVAGKQVYTAPFWLKGKNTYRIYSTQIDGYFRTQDISYNAAAGSFTVLVPGFVLQPAEQLIINPFVLNPDSP